MAFQGRLASAVATVVGDEAASGLQGRIAQTKQIAGFGVVEVVHEPQCQHDVKGSELLDVVVTDTLADECSAVAIALPRRIYVRRINIDSRVVALGQKGQHVARTAADVEDVIRGLGPDVLLHQHPAPIIGADEAVIELVEIRTFENRPHQFNHVYLTPYLFLVAKTAYWPPSGNPPNQASTASPVLR